MDDTDDKNLKDDMQSALDHRVLNHVSDAPNSTIKINISDSDWARRLINRGHNDYPEGEFCPDELLPTSWMLFHGNCGLTIQLFWKSGREDARCYLDVPHIAPPEWLAKLKTAVIERIRHGKFH